MRHSIGHRKKLLTSLIRKTRKFVLEPSILAAELVKFAMPAIEENQRYYKPFIRSTRPTVIKVMIAIR